MLRGSSRGELDGGRAESRCRHERDREIEIRCPQHNIPFRLTWQGLRLWPEVGAQQHVVGGDMERHFPGGTFLPKRDMGEGGGERVAAPARIRCDHPVTDTGLKGEVLGIESVNRLRGQAGVAQAELPESPL